MQIEAVLRGHLLEDPKLVDFEGVRERTDCTIVEQQSKAKEDEDR
jgi:hypothetical protein